MRVLILNQAFWPDPVATAQYAASLAAELAARGHEVTVLAGNRAYDDPARRFPSEGVWKGVRIQRIGTLGLGKKSILHRSLDFLAFFAGLAVQMARLLRQDVVLALTTPPLIAFFGACLTRLRGGRLVYWVMDLNPDQAIAAGLFAKGSLPARFLEALLRFVLRSSDTIIALDRFVKARLEARLRPMGKIVVIPPWSLDEQVEFDPAGREEFRHQHGISDKFVVMYSGNHSPCHPLDTLLAAALELAVDPRFVFLFVGGGVEQAKVRAFAAQHQLSNIRCLPYQPIERLSGSLSAADLHVVVLGDAFVGIVHPCKIYNILKIGAPVLYIGPQESHVSDLAAGSAGWLLAARHGEVSRVVQNIRAGAGRSDPKLASAFSRERLLNQVVEVLEVSKSGRTGLAEITSVE